VETGVPSRKVKVYQFMLPEKNIWTISKGNEKLCTGGPYIYKLVCGITDRLYAPSDHAGVQAACSAKGRVTPCTGNANCPYSSSCTLTSETGCGWSMRDLARALGCSSPIAGYLRECMSTSPPSPTAIEARCKFLLEYIVKASIDRS